MANTALIVTSREYFSEFQVAEEIQGQQFSSILEQFVDDVELEEDDQQYLESLEGLEKEQTEFKVKLFSFYSRDMQHDFISDYMYDWYEAESMEFPIKKIPVNNDYVVYVAPCYPLWWKSSDFITRQNYLASVVQCCMEDNEASNYIVISHDKDMFPDHLCKIPEITDVLPDTLLDKMIKENKLNISGMYCFMHSRTSKMYVDFVEKLHHGVTTDMCDLALKLVRE